MLNYNSPLKKEINYNNISIKEISPIVKINLRGEKREFFTAVGKSLDMILPIEPNTSSSSSKLTSIWLSPDEWMIISNDKMEKDIDQYKLQENLYNALSKTNLGIALLKNNSLSLISVYPFIISFGFFVAASINFFKSLGLKKGSSPCTLI